MDRSVTVSGKQLSKNELQRAFAAARRYARKGRAKSTWRAYRVDMHRNLSQKQYLFASEIDPAAAV